MYYTYMYMYMCVVIAELCEDRAIMYLCECVCHGSPSLQTWLIAGMSIVLKIHDIVQLHVHMHVYKHNTVIGSS